MAEFFGGASHRPAILEAPLEVGYFPWVYDPNIVSVFLGDPSFLHSRHHSIDSCFNVEKTNTKNGAGNGL